MNSINSRQNAQKIKNFSQSVTRKDTIRNGKQVDKPYQDTPVTKSKKDLLQSKSPGEDLSFKY